jgi:superfamily I DNA/RNA helicase
MIRITLDEQQQAAAETDSRRALVIAGAGSGKTRVIIARIADLITSKKVSPYEIMAFSFTRAAAGELRGRLSDILPLHHVGKMQISTIHAIGLSWLKIHGAAVGFDKPSKITVYSDIEAQELLKNTMHEMRIKKGASNKINTGTIKRAFDTYYQGGGRPGREHEAFNVFNAFKARCRENNAVTFGEILVLMERLIDEVYKHRIGGNIRHLLVDEVQDIDALQWRIIEKIAATFGASLFAVGDIDQSIYAFRGAVPGHILDTISTFETFRLETNYRSGLRIVSGANSLIRHNVARIDKAMTAARRDKLAYNDIMTRADIDSAALADMIQAEAAAGLNPDNTAVLSRVHYLLEKLDGELTERGVEHKYYGRNIGIISSIQFSRIHAFFKLLTNPFDNFSFYLIDPFLSDFDEGISDIRARAFKDSTSFLTSYMKGAGSDDPVAGFFKEFIYSDNLVDAFANIRAIVTNEGPYKAEGRGFNGGDMAENAALGLIGRFVFENQRATVQDYLNHITFLTVQDEIKKDDPGVKLLTIHGAKGLEFDRVYIAGCNNRIIPSNQAIGGGISAIEEERRLFYVAITRARDVLTFCVRPKNDDLDAGPSIFIRESTGS